MIFIKRLIKNYEFYELKNKSIFIKCINFTIKLNDQTYIIIFDKIHVYQMILKLLQ